ncbi:hypothetical protein, partial [Mariniphaga sediminis]|uniref:hypothetical protein n=1 Tax=Mariniphaga sediminis TaxID=1628158 RepID=UPI00356839E9
YPFSTFGCKIHYKMQTAWAVRWNIFNKGGKYVFEKKFSICCIFVRYSDFYRYGLSVSIRLK